MGQRAFIEEGSRSGTHTAPAYTKKASKNGSVEPTTEPPFSNPMNPFREREKEGVSSDAEREREKKKEKEGTTEREEGKEREKGEQQWHHFVVSG